MRAITIPRFGGPEVLELSERESGASTGKLVLEVREQRPPLGSSGS